MEASSGRVVSLHLTVATSLLVFYKHYLALLDWRFLGMAHPHKVMQQHDESVGQILLWTLIGFSVLTGFFLLGLF
jgi:hypothetical protein